MFDNRAIVMVMVVFVAFVFLPFSAEAASTDVSAGMSEKLHRGYINSVSGVFELPVQTVKGAKHGIKQIDYAPVSHPLGTVFGMYRGVSHGTGRTLSGLSDVIGFWAADPVSNEGVGEPLDAKDVFEEGTQYSYWEPDPVKGMEPLGRKGVRGLGNGTFSFMELPGQFMKESKNGNPVYGLAKGSWLGLSRLHSGITDVATFYAPNPTETAGYTFEEKNPWDAFTGKE